MRRFLSARNLLRTGPEKSDIFAGFIHEKLYAFIVKVNARVTRATSTIPSLHITSQFRNASLQSLNIILPGDLLTLSVWENTNNGLLTGPATNSAELDAVQVDSDGYIFVPYARHIKTAGNNPDTILGFITDRLQYHTPDPKLLVSRSAGSKSTVSIIGAFVGQNIYVIEPPTLTLSSMHAKSGGVAIDPELAQITFIRGLRRENLATGSLRLS